MQMILIKKSGFEYFDCGIDGMCSQFDGYNFVWLTKHDAMLFQKEAGIQISYDVFLDYYIEDINNPTGTELSLLELATGIIYDAHN